MGMKFVRSIKKKYWTALQILDKNVIFFITQPKLKSKSDRNYPSDCFHICNPSLKKISKNYSSGIYKWSPHGEHNRYQGVTAEYNINSDLRTDLSVYRHIFDITSGASYKVVNNDEFSPLFASNFTVSGGVFGERYKSGDIFYLVGCAIP